MSSKDIDEILDELRSEFISAEEYSGQQYLQVHEEAMGSAKTAINKLIADKCREAKQEEWDYLKGSGEALTQAGEKDAGTIVRAAVMVRETMYKDHLKNNKPEGAADV
jgi:hypothetical protein